MHDTVNTKCEKFMEEFISQIRRRFDALEYYKKVEGIKQIPIEFLEKSPRWNDFLLAVYSPFLKNETDINKKKESAEKEENEDQQNSLKIELYPKKKARYKFEKSSLKSLITCQTLGFSFDENNELAYINSKTPVLNGFYLAHSNHYPIRIKPDDIWLLIVQDYPLERAYPK